MDSEGLPCHGRSRSTADRPEGRDARSLLCNSAFRVRDTLHRAREAHAFSLVISPLPPRLPSFRRADRLEDLAASHVSRSMSISDVPPVLPLVYTIVSSSDHSGKYVAENILVDSPMDQGSRWSGAYQASNQKQWVVLKLDRLSILR